MFPRRRHAEKGAGKEWKPDDPVWYAERWKTTGAHAALPRKPEEGDGQRPGDRRDSRQAMPTESGFSFPLKYRPGGMKASGLKWSAGDSRLVT